MKKIIKLFIKQISYLLYILCKSFPCGKILTKAEAENVLQKNGFTFPKLSMGLKPLSPPTIDVSLIIPCYNAEKFIPTLMKSVLGQKTHYSYEVICVDDGSKDNTLNLLKEYEKTAQGRLVVFSQENKGISIARNVGIELSHGSYIGFIDNDDIIDECFVEVAFTKAKTTHADLLQCGYEMRSTHESSTSTKCNYISENNDYQRFSVMRGFIWGALYKREVFEMARFPEKFWYEDMLNKMLLTNILKRVVIIEDVLYIKRIHSENASSILWKNANIKSVEQYWLVQLFIEYTINDLHQDISEAQYVQIIKEFATLLWSRTRNLPHEVRYATFSLAADTVKSIDYKIKEMPNKLQEVESSLKAGNYHAWNFLCLSLLWEKE